MACAAPLDKCWCRGVITDIPAEKLVEVFYVDTGHKRSMFFNQIRKMQQKYMNFATQVRMTPLKCKKLFLSCFKKVINSIVFSK